MGNLEELNQGLRWYVAHTYSGYESKVKASLEKIVENRGLGNLIYDIRIPVRRYVETVNGKEKEVEEKIYPCYVYVKMIMTGESWHAVRNITGVTGFVGPGSRPTPLSEEEVASLCFEENAESTEARLAFAAGDTVEIIGPFLTGRSGQVVEISEDLKKATVLVKQTNRDMSVEIECENLKKVD